MYKFLLVSFLTLFVANCSCKCRYDEYLPENNPLVIPDDLKPVQK